MKTIETAEIKEWLSQQNLLNTDGKIDRHSFPYSFEIQNPIDSGKKATLSRTIVAIFSSCHIVLFWIHEYGIWESSQIMHLFDALRLSVNEQRHVYEAPGHLFEQSDSTFFISALALVLYFYWGVNIICQEKEIYVQANHEGVITVYTKSMVMENKLKSDLSDFLFQGA